MFSIDAILCATMTMVEPGKLGEGGGAGIRLGGESVDFVPRVEADRLLDDLPERKCEADRQAGRYCLHSCHESGHLD